VRRAVPVFVAYALAIGLFVLGAVLAIPAVRLVGKTLPVVLLAVWVARSTAPSPFRTRVVFGLALCAVGDLVLDLGLFVPGLLAFLVGHLGYVAAFTSETRAPHVLRALPFLAWGACALALLSGGLGPLAVPVSLYTATICVMMWRACALVGRERPWATVLAVGAVLFATSDTLIAVSKFHAPFAGAPVAILSLYWLGQALIAKGSVARG
jgi:uncharacterized membrane protein YhhN